MQIKGILIELIIVVVTVFIVAVASVVDLSLNLDIKNFFNRLDTKKLERIVTRGIAEAAVVVPVCLLVDS